MSGFDRCAFYVGWFSASVNVVILALGMGGKENAVIVVILAVLMYLFSLTAEDIHRLAAKEVDLDGEAEM